MTRTNKTLLNDWLLSLKTILHVKGDIKLTFYPCAAIGRHYRHNKTNSSKINLNPNYDMAVLIPTLIHEVEHVRQWESGDMKEGEKGIYHRWYKGVEYPDMQKIEHRQRPWEAEAYLALLRVAEDLGIEY